MTNTTTPNTTEAEAIWAQIEDLTPPEALAILMPIVFALQDEVDQFNQDR